MPSAFGEEGRLMDCTSLISSGVCEWVEQELSPILNAFVIAVGIECTAIIDLTHTKAKAEKRIES